MAAQMLAYQRRYSDPVQFEMRRRSAALSMDPKAQELRHFIGSHRHEERLRDAAGLNDVCEDALAQAARNIRQVAAEEYYEEHFDPMMGCKARLEWRAELDRGIRRLLQDQELMLDGRMHDQSKHALRCNHLDKTYDWYQTHGKKEASKERPAPAYLRFEADSPVMPGSLRRQSQPSGWVPTPPAPPEPPAPVMRRTPPTSAASSPAKGAQVSPSLMAAATQAISVPSGTPPTSINFSASPAPGRMVSTPVPMGSPTRAVSRPTTASGNPWVHY